MDRVGDLNVVFGRNDSGKSNLLRALNLFFNDETDRVGDFDFDVEIADQRKKEAREAKGRQFIWIKVTFNVPPNYRQSIGKEVAIKRQWDRDGDMNQTVFPPLDTPGKQARLTRFLNDIDFTYIPAIKDLEVYADLIERMYGAAADTGVLKEATDSFVSAIGEKTETLAAQLAELFKTPASLAAPTEMKRLFRNLDFSHGEDKHSLLRQKGDGIKARHLPEILRFINQTESRSRLYLWGFEEPENSLDLGAAEQESARFSNFASRDDTQVFITSHSPAFYLAEGKDGAQVRRYFITKQISNDDGMMEPANASFRIDDIDDAERKMEAAGLFQLPFVIRQIKEQRAELAAVKTEADSLREKVAALSMATLFTEGEHDVATFKAAFARLGVEEKISVRPLGGTPQTTEALISAVVEQGGLSPASATTFLFDNDFPGRSAFKKLCKDGVPGMPQNIGPSQTAWCIPLSSDFRHFLQKYNIREEQAFFTLEFLYPIEESAELCLSLIEKYPPDGNWHDQINGQYWKSLAQPTALALANAERGSKDWFLARGVPDSLKKKFRNAAEKRGLSTSEIDSIATQIKAMSIG